MLKKVAMGDLSAKAIRVPHNNTEGQASGRIRLSDVLQFLNGLLIIDVARLR